MCSILDSASLKALSPVLMLVAIYGRSCLVYPKVDLYVIIPKYNDSDLAEITSCSVLFHFHKQTFVGAIFNYRII